MCALQPRDKKPNWDRLFELAAGQLPATLADECGVCSGRADFLLRVERPTRSLGAYGLCRLWLKANTVKTRTMSLFNQGWFWYRALPGPRQERLEMLMTAFGRIVQRHAVFREIFGEI